MAVLGLCSACIIVAALFASLSRGGVMAFTVASVVFLALSALRRWRLKRALAVMVALVLMWGIGLHYGGQRLRQRFDQVDWSRGARPHLWRGALRMCADFPVFGVGLGCFEHAFPRYKPVALGDQFYRAAHCDVLQAFVEMGALGAVAIVAMLGCITVPALRQIRNSRSRSGSWLLVGELSGLSAMLAHSLVDFNLRIPANALLFVVILALTHNTVRGLRLAQHYADTRTAAKV